MCSSSHFWWSIALHWTERSVEMAGFQREWPELRWRILFPRRSIISTVEMFKSARWRSEKNKIKIVFKLQFHATQVISLSPSLRFFRCGGFLDSGNVDGRNGEDRCSDFEISRHLGNKNKSIWHLIWLV